MVLGTSNIKRHKRFAVEKLSAQLEIAPLLRRDPEREFQSEDRDKLNAHYFRITIFCVAEKPPALSIRGKNSSYRTIYNNLLFIISFSLKTTKLYIGFDTHVKLNLKNNV